MVGLWLNTFNTSISVCLKLNSVFLPILKQPPLSNLLFLCHLPSISQRYEFLSVLTTSLLVRTLVLHAVVVVISP